jgi:nitric oxide reductase subunit B
MNYRKLWISLTLVMVISFAVLGYFGRAIYQKAPPIPERVVATEGEVVYTAQQIKDGRNVWQSAGG